MADAVIVFSTSARGRCRPRATIIPHIVRDEWDRWAGIGGEFWGSSGEARRGEKARSWGDSCDGCGDEREQNGRRESIYREIGGGVVGRHGCMRDVGKKFFGVGCAVREREWAGRREGRWGTRMRKDKEEDEHGTCGHARGGGSEPRDTFHVISVAFKPLPNGERRGKRVTWRLDVHAAVGDGRARAIAETLRSRAGCTSGAFLLPPYLPPTFASSKAFSLPPSRKIKRGAQCRCAHTNTHCATRLASAPAVSC